MKELFYGSILLGWGIMMDLIWFDEMYKFWHRNDDK